jgi:hypothetical protein
MPPIPSVTWSWSISVSGRVVVRVVLAETSPNGSHYRLLWSS